MPLINHLILGQSKDIKDGWTNADDEFKKQFGARLSPQFSFLLKQLGLSDDQYILISFMISLYFLMQCIARISKFLSLIHYENFKYRPDGN